MRQKILFFMSAAVTALILPMFAGRDKTALPDRYTKWLDEEAVHIITPVEGEVFLKLRSDRERDLFIEAFWSHRDPTPGTPANEFKTEHYRRLIYADKFFGRETPKPGWMTDRGRIYIILGEPKEIQRYQDRPGLCNCEIWFYQGGAGSGLPPGFNLLFFQEKGGGEYRLYNPSLDGPQALLTDSFASAANSLRAFQELKDIDPILAEASLSLIPGERNEGEGRSSLASEMIIQKIEASPRRLVEEEYARKFLRYKDIVDVEYSANYVDSLFLVRVIKDPSGLSFVHYAVELKRLSVYDTGGKYSTALKIAGSVVAKDGRRVYQFDKTIPIEMDEEQMKTRAGCPFDYNDLFPLVPGEYSLSLLIKNEASKEFTSVEASLRIPGDTPALRMSSPLLAYKVMPAESKDKKRRPFVFGAYQIYCQPGSIFLQKDTLSVAFQFLGLSDELRQKGEVKYRFFRDGQIFKEETRQAAAGLRIPDVIEDFPLSGFPPAHYTLRISFLADGQEITTAADEFDVSPMTAVPRPWITLRALPETGHSYYDHLAGIQLYNLGRPEEAKEKLETAFRKEPSEEAAADLGRIYISLKSYDKVEPLLAPYFDRAGSRGYEMYMMTGQALRNLGDYARAAGLYERALSNCGNSSNILNLLGDCFKELGRSDDALSAWEKSLSINADQPEIRKNIERLKMEKRAGKNP